MATQKKCKELGHRRLAEGETTGHFHEATGDGVALFEDGPNNNNIIFEAPNGSTVTHQEHNPVTIPPGTYDRGIVLEYDHFIEEARQVAD